jgi:hypothetical protein
MPDTIFLAPARQPAWVSRTTGTARVAIFMWTLSLPSNEDFLANFFGVRRSQQPKPSSLLHDLTQRILIGLLMLRYVNPCDDDVDDHFSCLPKPYFAFSHCGGGGDGVSTTAPRLYAMI